MNGKFQRTLPLPNPAAVSRVAADAKIVANTAKVESTADVESIEVTASTADMEREREDTTTEYHCR